MHVRIALITLFFILTINAFSQEKYPIRYLFIEPKIHVGKPIVYSDSLSNSINNPYSALDLRVGMYARGKHKQDYYFHTPTFGLGFYAPNYNSDTIGNPYTLYAFFNAPFVRRDRFSFNWEISMGMGWGFNEFHPITNPKNDLIGSDKNLFGHFNLSLAYMLSKQLELTSGIHFSHFSNGALKMPNKGFNMYGTNLSLKYHIAIKPESDGQFRPESKKPINGLKGHEVSVNYAHGTKTAIKKATGDILYYASSVGVDYMYRYHWVGAIGGGIEYLYDGSLKEIFPLGEKGPLYHTMIGIHAGHEVKSGGMTLIFQMGSYLWKNVEAKGYLYMRTGIKKHFGEHFFGTFTLKTLDGFRADYLELAVGYRFIKSHHKTN